MADSIVPPTPPPPPLRTESDPKIPEAPAPEPSKTVTPEDLPDPQERLPGVVIFSHSGLLYWWPVWAVGLLLAAVSYLFGRGFATDDGHIEWIHPNTGVGFTFNYATQSWDI